MATKPDLGIKNPYALDQKQFDAAIDLIKAAKPQVGSFWAAYADAQKALENGSTVVGSTWQIIVNLAQADKAPGRLGPAQGGRDRLGGHLDDRRQVAAPELRVHVDELDHQPGRPGAGRRVVRRGAGEHQGVRPDRRTRTTARRTTPTDETYFKKIWFWATPQSDCLDGRTDVKCIPYAEWSKAWSDLRNS